jgi:translation elongation factor EF-G
VPRLCFINKMDQIGADFERTVQMIADRLGARPIVLQFPLGNEGDFVGVIDLVSMNALRWDAASPAPTVSAIPEWMSVAADEGRQRLVEALADTDEAIMVAYVGGETVEASRIKAAIRKACLAGRLTPVLCGSAYRNVSRWSEVDHTLRKQSGGPEQMARVRLGFEALVEGETGLIFINEVVGGAIPKEFVPSIEKALRQSMLDGGPGGYAVLGLRVSLLDGAFHEKDSSGLAFELAVREAFRIGFEHAAPILLEPMSRIVVTTPEDYLGAVIGDLRRRRGKVLVTGPLSRAQEVIAEAALAELFNYVSALRSLSQGRASFTMAFSRYAPLPTALAEKVLQRA